MTLPTPYFQDDSVTIYHADCRDIVPLLPKVDLILTDPPYGTGQNPHRDPQARTKLAATKFYGSWDWDRKIDQSLLQMVVKAGLMQILWGGNLYADWLPPSTAWLVWDKDNAGTPFGDCELAWTSSPRAIRLFKWRWNGMLQENMKDKEYRFHPTQKPVPLMRWCLQLAPNAQTILDPFMGSGTTLRAAKDLGRKAIGIEIEEKYCEIAANRMSQSAMRLEA
jgi:DNA modification methylase